MTLALTIFGVVLSTMHQSSLGALYLIAPSKLHPLWYSAYLPVFFFVSSIAAGLSMVIFEGTLSHHYLHGKMDATYLAEHDGVVLGFAKGAAMVLAGYFCIKVVGLALDNKWNYLLTGYGAWFLVELLGFVAAAGHPLCHRRSGSSNLTLAQVDLGPHRPGHRAEPLQRVPGGLQLAAGPGRPLFPQLDGDRPVALSSSPSGS